MGLWEQTLEFGKSLFPVYNEAEVRDEAFQENYSLIDPLTDYPSVIEIHGDPFCFDEATGNYALFQGKYGESYILKLSFETDNFENFRDVGSSEFSKVVDEIYGWEQPMDNLLVGYDFSSNKASILIQDEGQEEAREFAQELVSALDKM